MNLLKRSYKPGILLLVLTVIIGSHSCKLNSSSDQPVNEVVGVDPNIDHISGLIKENPDDATLWVKRAEEYYKLDGFDEAISDLSQAMAIDSLNPDYYHMLADVLLDYYKSQQALHVLERALVVFPERVPTLLKYAEFLTILKKHTESNVAVDRALKQDPQNADAYFMYGLNAREMGDTIKALHYLQSSVELDPDNLDSYLMLAQLNQRRGNFRLAKKYYGNALRIDSNNVNTLYAVGLHYQKQDKFEEALFFYRKVSAIDFQNSASYFNQGIVHCLQADFEKGHSLFTTAIKVDPAYAEAYYYRGLSAEQMGRIEGARADFLSALNLKNDYPEAELGLARVGK